MTDKEREELAEVIGKGLASGSKISAEDLQNENTISYKMGEIMEMDADFVTLLNFVDWYSPTKEVNEKLTKMLRHIAGQTYQNQTKVADLEKENTELKKQLEMRNKVCNDNLDYSHHIEEQLTKAKDHIKKLLDCLKQDTNDPQTNYYVCQYMDKAEQFLNSEVEK